MRRLLAATLFLGSMTAGHAQEAARDIDLYDAIRNGRSDLVEIFLAAGGDPNLRIDDSPMGETTLLKIAVFGYREEIALMLVGAGAGLDGSGIDIENVSVAGMDELLAFLLEAEAAPVSAERLGLDRAALHGHYDAVALLLEYASRHDLDWGSLRSNAVNRALAAGFDDIARLLLQDGGRPTAAELRQAVRFSSPGMVSYMLSLGADPAEPYQDPLAGIRRVSQDGFTAIDYAWSEYREATGVGRLVAAFKIHELLSAGAMLDDPDGVSAARDGAAELGRMADRTERLTSAVDWGFHDEVGRLTESGEVGDPAILKEAAIRAIGTNWDDIARLLLSAGAEPGGGLLHAAAARSSPGMVESILMLDADPNEEWNGYTPAQYWWHQDPSRPEQRRSGGRPEVLQRLIAAGADVCWLTEHLDEIGLSANILWTSAPECWQ